MKQEIISFLPEDSLWQNRILWFDTLPSTNTLAKEMAKNGAPHGTVILANQQTGGRGRLGRSFQSTAGLGIYMSMILRFPCPPSELIHLTCATAVATCDAVARTVSLRPQIKWTNDLIIGQRKLAGILTELVCTPSDTAAIIGIGINCHHKPSDFSPEIRDTAISLSTAIGHEISRAELTANLIAALWNMDICQKQPIMAQYRWDCATLGKDISVICGDTVRFGHALDIDDDGGLLVRYPGDETEIVRSGEVSIRGMYGYADN